MQFWEVFAITRSLEHGKSTMMAAVCCCNTVDDADDIKSLILLHNTGRVGKFLVTGGIGDCGFVYYGD